MIDFMELFYVHNAYVDEDGFLSFNPKHGKTVGLVRVTNFEIDCPTYDVSTFSHPQSYVCGPKNCVVAYEITVLGDFLDDLESPKEKKVEPKIKLKEISKTQEEFSFLDLSEV